MKKKFLPWIIILGVLAVLAIWGISSYNSIITAEENVSTAWSQVENQYQRRADLIPNLVETVKGYTSHESTTLENVVAARAKATQITIDPTNATPEQLVAFQNAQGELSQALGRLMAITENYPDLKANKNFEALQSQLEGTENRITVARNNFNEEARRYNTLIRRFPSNIIANMLGSEKRPYFESAEGSNQAPKVQF
jgi:LemA protein